MLVKERLTQALTEALSDLRETGDLTPESTPSIRLDVPPSPELGDFSSDLAVMVSRASGQPVGPIAEALAARLREHDRLVERVEISSAGFLNVRLQPGWLEEAVREARVRRGEFGRSQNDAGTRVLVEFVSAYPTAPLTVLHGRGAAVGDALANVLEWNGCQVTREFYVNDAGSRFERFARSVEAEYLKQFGRDVRPPADGFSGEYLAEVVQEIRERVGDRYLHAPVEERQRWLAVLGRDAMLDRQRATLASFGVRFDEWRFESELLASGVFDEALRRMREQDLVYEADGATWLRTTRLGDETDRPLRRSNGEATYLAGDLAYHLDKFQRGFDRVVDIWGPDHETYVRRTLIGIQALGYTPNAVEIQVLQPVTVKIDGGRVNAAAAGGNNLLLSEVIEELGREEIRLRYLCAGVGAALELDLDRAREESADNPAYRVRSTFEAGLRLLDAAAAEGMLPAPETAESLPAGDQHAKLARRLADFPDEVRQAALELDPSRIAQYSIELADLLAPELPGSGGAPDAALLPLVDAAVVALGNALEILGCLPETAA